MRRLLPCLALLALSLTACDDGGAGQLSAARVVRVPDAGRAPPMRDAAVLMDAATADAGVVGPDPDATVDPPWDARLADADTGPAPDADVLEPDAAIEPEPDAEVPAPDAGPIDPGCPIGASCNPIVVDEFPSEHAGDTREAPTSEIDLYDCPDDGADESGPEVYYVVDLPARGVLSVQVDDVPGDDVDVDLYLLGGPAAAQCMTRGNRQLSWTLDEGRWWIVADTWVNGRGEALAGPYTLTFAFLPVIESECRTEQVDLRMFWRDCSAGVDCFEADGERYLRTPTTGPVVKEAHLVTTEEEFPNGWPVSARDGLDWHVAISTLATGFVGDRTEPWAPAGEGGSRWGQGATGGRVPVIDEAWYINMYWRDRPPRGTRMLVRNPANGRSVVASAGWETGPGSNTAVAGVVEEIHTYLGTTHRDDLEVGFLLDQALPFGPVECD